MLHMLADEPAAKQFLRMQPLKKRTAMVTFWQRRAARMSSPIGQLSMLNAAFIFIGCNWRVDAIFLGCYRAYSNQCKCEAIATAAICIQFREQVDDEAASDEDPPPEDSPLNGAGAHILPFSACLLRIWPGSKVIVPQGAQEMHVCHTHSPMG